MRQAEYQPRLWEISWDVWEEHLGEIWPKGSGHVLHAVLTWSLQQAQLLSIPEVKSLLVFLFCFLEFLFFSQDSGASENGACICHQHTLSPLLMTKSLISKVQVLLGPCYLFVADHLIIIPLSGMVITTFYLPDFLARLMLPACLDSMILTLSGLSGI